MKYSPRPGTAPIEFALVLPFLFVLFAGILWVGQAGAARTAALGAAREHAWADGPTVDPGAVLRLNHDPAPSATEYRSVQPFRGYGPLSGRAWSATAVTGSHFRSWAGDDVPTDGPRSSDRATPTELIRLLVQRNPDTMPQSGAQLPELDAVRFVDPAYEPGARSLNSAAIPTRP